LIMRIHVQAHVGIAHLFERGERLLHHLG